MTQGRSVRASDDRLLLAATDDREFGKRLLDLLFEGFWQEVGE